jgi:Holliday junction resolvase RusA-like endonuclease
MPKPRGKLSAHGHIYHNDSKYRAYTQRVLTECSRHIDAPIPAQTPFCVGLFNGYKQGKGHQPDLDNLVGSLLDCLKKGGIIKDDSRSHWVASYLRCCKLAEDHNLLILCDLSKQFDMIESIQNYLKSLQNTL